MNPSVPEGSSVLNVPDPAQNRLFCSGQTLLKDGRLMVTGGTSMGETGSGQVLTYDATKYFQSSKGWAVQDTMKIGRWYATATELQGGKVLVTSGQNYYNVVSFGGIGVGSARFKDMRRFANKNRGAKWNADPFTATDSVPSARDGHVSVWVTATEMLVFGGQDASGVRNDLWRLRRTDQDAGERWVWTHVIPADDPIYGHPDQRTRAAAVLIGDTLVIHGGLKIVGSTETVLDDVWRLKLVDPGSRWERVLPGNIGPGGRYNHALLLDPGYIAAHIPTPRIMVHGGRDAVGLADSAVWSLPLSRSGPSGTPLWTKIAVGGPTLREGHVVVRDPFRESGYTNPAICGSCCDTARIDILVFGGKGTSLPQNDTWSFTRVDKSGDSTSAFYWRYFQPGSGTPPPKRWRAAASYDSESDRLLVQGGDTTGTGGYANDLWGLSLNYSFRCTLPGWKKVAADSLPAPRAGHSFVFDARPVFAREPELFNAHTGTPQSTLLDAPKRLGNYPHMFLLSSGKLFFAGNRDSSGTGPSYLFDPAEVANPWQTQRLSGFVGGSSVMFRPDTVLKFAGSWYTDINHIDKIIFANDPSAGWLDVAGPDPSDRALHNLTLLPTGQVLVTSGIKNAAREIRYEPQIFTWNDSLGSASWGPLLAPDIYKREYHSTAVLLPDARVLVSGGKPSGQQGTIFAPPYLFNSSGGPATQPTISTAPDSIGYGSTFQVTCPTATNIRSVALLRPGAATHAFDMSQKYVRLAVAASGTTLTITVPSCGTNAPPGDYMLFLVDKSGVPSDAKWLRLKQGVPAPVISDLDADLVSKYSIGVIWTAPGAICSGGADAYDLRYYTVPITEFNFSSAYPVTTDPPKEPGNGEFKLVTGLLPCRTYYFAIKWRYYASSWSAISSPQTIGSTSCGGGFGPMASSGGDSGWSSENTVLQWSPEQVQNSDVLELGGLSPAPDGTYRVRLVGGPAQVTSLDQVRLSLVDHAPAVQMYPLGADLWLGAALPPLRVTSGSGADLTAALATGTPYRAENAEHLGVTLSPSASGPESRFLLLRVANASGSPGAMVRVQEPGGGAGEWGNRANLVTRPRTGELLWGPLASDSVRLEFAGAHELEWIGVVSGPQIGAVTKLSLLAANHSRAGSVAAAISGTDTLSSALMPGDTLLLRFASAPLSAGLVRELLLTARGMTDILTGMGTSARYDPRLDAAPAQFALHQNHPNPFASMSVIRFDLSVTSHVTIDIFDVQGRRVRRLVDRDHEPGRLSIGWDRRDGQGRQLGAGVYLYRMSAGTFQARRKMVVLP